MPKYWYNRSSNSAEEFPDEEERKFNLRILADKKPYFMRYIYPNLMSQYRNYIKNTDKKCLREFRITMDELLSKDRGALTEREREFLFWYYEKMRIGRRFEEEFDHYLSKYKKSTVPFDYTILKSGAKYSHEQFLAVAEGTVTTEEAIAEVKLRSRQYAKRQLTWLRRNPDIFWVRWQRDPNFPEGLQKATEYLHRRGLC